MRRKDREITDLSEIESILRRCRVCRLAMSDEEGLYIVPLNFGYRLEEGVLTLYFHSAPEGRKIAAITQNGAVAFEMDGGHQLVGGDTPCAYGYLYESVTGTGQAKLLAEPAEKIAALQMIMRQQSGKEFSFTAAMVQKVCVFQVTANCFTAKARRR